MAFQIVKLLDAVTITGPQGPQGGDGATGPQGTQGTQGDTGVQGAQGDNGAAGPQGAQGDTGADSTVAGPQGTQGAVGAQGTQGDQGEAGVQGAQGDEGAAGPQGAQGAQGTQGSTGSIGAIDSSPDSDHTVSGMSSTLTAGAALSFGQVCYMGSDGKMELTDADAIASCGGFAMVADATIDENATGSFLLHGYARDDTWNWATLGGFLYADTATAGGMTQTAPTGTDDVIQILGVAITADIVYFNPQLVQVEHV